MFLRIWWSWFPSVGINVYYRMLRFVQTLPDIAFRQHCLKTAFDRCTPREQKFLTDIGVAPEETKPCS